MEGAEDSESGKKKPVSGGPKNIGKAARVLLWQFRRIRLNLTEFSRI